MITEPLTLDLHDIEVPPPTKRMRPPADTLPPPSGYGDLIRWSTDEAPSGSALLRLRGGT